MTGTPSVDAGTTAGTAEERQALREVVRRVLARDSAPGDVRRVAEEPAGVDQRLWRTMAELGWTGLEIPEAYGGAGYGFGEVAVVLEELGRHVTPGPFLSTVILAGGALIAAGDEPRKRELLPAIAAGELTAALVLPPVPGRHGPVARTARGGHVLDGTAELVLDAHRAGVLIVAAHHAGEGDGADATGGGGRTLFVVPPSTTGVSVRVRPTVDMTRRLCDVTFDGVELPDEAVLGEPGAAGGVLDWLADRAAAALAADAVGGAQRVMEMTVDYVKVRVQFGRPIGTFQAIKHRCADMLLLVEAARAAAEEAADRSPAMPGAPNLSASVAKSYACEAYAKVAGDGIQLHGGIGFTWEHDIHLYFKRAKLDQALFGDARWHRSRIADAVVPRTTPS